MILVDTSVWIDHLRSVDTALGSLLNRNEVLIHPFVVGELACGNLRQRDTVLALLQALPEAPLAEHDEVMHFIGRHSLMGRGIGYVDVHLLAATKLVPFAQLWTRDRRLLETTRSMGLAYSSARG